MNYQDIFDTADPGTFKKHSDETRAKIREGRKGYKPTPETWAKRHAANVAKKGKPRKMTAEHVANIQKVKCKPIMTPHGLFPSKAAVIKAAGVCSTTVGHWLKKFPNDYYYV
jgi:hypothetical protein